MFKVVLALASVCWLVGCSSDANSSAAKADIGKIVDVKPSFGPEFKVVDVAPRGIDPQFFASRKLPEGLTFDPPNCAKAAVGPDMPAGLQGNMAAVSAEGKGNRFVVIGLETSQALPFNDPGKDCGKIAFTGAGVRGAVEVIDPPKIDGTQTLGIHRVLQAVGYGAAGTGRVYRYSARFRAHLGIVLPHSPFFPQQTPAPRRPPQTRHLPAHAC